MSLGKVELYTSGNCLTTQGYIPRISSTFAGQHVYTRGHAQIFVKKPSAVINDEKFIRYLVLQLKKIRNCLNPQGYIPRKSQTFAGSYAHTRRHV